MCIGKIGEPQRNEFPSYASYACATIGYAFLLGGTTTAWPGRDAVCCCSVVGGNESCDQVRSLGGGVAARLGISESGSGGRTVDVGDVSRGNVCAPGVDRDSSRGAGNATAVVGDDTFVESVGSSRGCGETSSVAGAGLSSVRPVVYTGLPRGPNYERNQANRARKKAIRAARQAGIPLAGESTVRVERDEDGGTERVGHFAGLEPEVQDKLIRTRAERLILENEAKITEYKEEAAKRRHGLHHATEAVKAMKMADSWRKSAKVDGPGASVYGWAETIATSSSESIARASPVRSLASVDSKVSAKSSVSVATNGFDFVSQPMNKFEKYLCSEHEFTSNRIMTLRRKIRGPIHLEHCSGKDCKVRLTREAIEDFCVLVLANL